jgi:hypothetical protein
MPVTTAPRCLNALAKAWNAGNRSGPSSATWTDTDRVYLRYPLASSTCFRKENPVERTSALSSPLAVVLALAALPAMAAEPAPRATLDIRRAPGAIAIDGDLSDAGWQDVATIETFYEISPGINLEPQVKSVARLAYDDRHLYVAFELATRPGAIRRRYRS